MLRASLILFGVLSLLYSSVGSLAYIPAAPANATGNPALANTTEVSELKIRWRPNGTYTTPVSYLLAGRNSKGLTKGAFLIVKEDTLIQRNDPTKTPWIAFVRCDANSTNASAETDMFSLAARLGARAVLLYSDYSDGCVINPGYAQQTFNGLFDVFTTTRSTVAKLIVSQFREITPDWWTYNPGFLNASYDLIQSSFNDTTNVTAFSLVASLKASNATGDESSAAKALLPSGSGSLVGVGLMLILGLLAVHL